MNGYQLTFYTEKNRKHGHQTVCEWLMQEVRKMGIHGVTVINCAEGVGHAGARHAAHVLKLTDQPLQIILAVTEEEAEKLLEHVRAEHVPLFYMRFPVEYGLIGDDSPGKPVKQFSLFRRSSD
jgi:PII-like signaling protein